MAGADERKQTPTGRSREPDLRHHYRYRLPEVDPDDIDFRVRVLRRGGAKPLTVQPETLSWEEPDNGLIGSIGLRRPDPDDAGSLPLGRGHRPEVSVRWGGTWYKLWTLRMGVGTPDPQLGAVTFELTDEFAMAGMTRRDWRYRKDKGHPKGWIGHEAARDVCRKAGIRIGSLTRTKVRITNLKKLNAHPLTVLVSIYEKERRKTGRRFIIRFRDGKLDIVPYRRNRVLWVFRHPSDVTVTLKGSTEPVTALTGKARIGKGKNARKVRHTEAHPDVVKRFGYKHKTKDYGSLVSASALQDEVKRDYADAVRVKREASFIVPIVPFLRRGDACQLLLPSEGFEGERSFCFITDVKHDAKTRRTTLTVTETDPFRQYQEELDKFRRDLARQRRKGRTGG